MSIHIQAPPLVELESNDALDPAVRDEGIHCVRGVWSGGHLTNQFTHHSRLGRHVLHRVLDKDSRTSSTDVRGIVRPFLHWRNTTTDHL